MEYRAVTKEDPKKDLTHWKYIKREKVNGKWRYSYNKEKQGSAEQAKMRANKTASTYNYYILKNTNVWADDVPEDIKNLAITVMCGPFFSVMPFPSVIHNGTVVHSLSHVRYTPHYEWYDKVPYTDPHEKLAHDSKNTAFGLMVKDASRYIPILSECKYLRSLWEVKTVLPRSETDDSRPILCNFNHGLKGYHCIMGGKIDNVYDAVAAIENDLGL